MNTIRQTEGKQQIKTVVKLNREDVLELFYKNDDEIICFTFKEGHNYCCIRYFYDQKHVDQSTAEAFLTAYNLGNEGNNEIFVYSKRL